MSPFCLGAMSFGEDLGWGSKLPVNVTFTEEELKTLDEASKLPAEYPGCTIGLWSRPREEPLKASRA